MAGGIPRREALLCAYKAAIFFCARAAGLDNKDTVAAVFMGSQKTLAFGLPLIKALFEAGETFVLFVVSFSPFLKPLNHQNNIHVSPCNQPPSPLSEYRLRARGCLYA